MNSSICTDKLKHSLILFSAGQDSIVWLYHSIYQFSVLVTQQCLTLQPHGLQPARFLCPWDFSRQKYWRGLPFPPSGDIPDSGIEPRSPSLQADSLLSETPGKPYYNQFLSNFCFQSMALTDEATVGICVDSSFGNCVSKYVGQNFRVRMTVLVIFVTDHLEGNQQLSIAINICISFSHISWFPFLLLPLTFITTKQISSFQICFTTCKQE